MGEGETVRSRAGRSFFLELGDDAVEGNQHALLQFEGQAVPSRIPKKPSQSGENMIK